jgi:pimeloyl-ACP methyl ester carboxylesterase
MLGTEGPGQTEHLPSGGDTAFIAFSALLGQRSQDAALPSLVQEAQRVFAALDARPVVVGNVTTGGGASVDVAFGGYDARVFVGSTLGDRRQLAQLPQVLGAMAGGLFEPLAQLKIQRLQNPFQSPWESLHDCQAGSSDERRAAVRHEARTALLGYATLDFAEACDGWGVSELPDLYRRPVRSAVPTLFVSGTLDGRTPVANAEEVRTRFRNSAHLILDGGSHGDDLFIATPAILRAILEFPSNGMRGVTRVPVD